MLLLDFMKEKIGSEHIVFEYGYYGVNGAFMKDEELSMEGEKEEMISFVQKQGNLRFLYACSGECNDFEMIQKDNTIYLKYIDFR
ncbi:MAG: hypothetical protein Q4E53_07835 [Eubacteriales bacterium]|nr:hypothetical protein [Eubacteriales bacterium]